MKYSRFQDRDLQSDRSNTDTAASNGLNVAEAMRQGAAALQQGGTTAGTARQNTRAGMAAMLGIGETVKETVRQGTEAMTEGQRQIAAATAHTFQDASRTVALAAQGTFQEMRWLATLPRAAEGGLRDMQQGMAGLFVGIVQANLRATQELFRLASPTAAVELHQQFVRECMDTAMRGTATLLQAVRRTADEVLDPLEVRIEQRQGARQDHRTAA